LNFITEYIEKSPYKDILYKLRDMALSLGFEEVVKWGKPCYTDNDKNVFLLSYFKPHAVLLFLKGDSMDDFAGLLHRSNFCVNGGRRIEFNDINEVVQLEQVIKQYMEQGRSMFRGT
jgi:uncharacterized protein YdeI (YjbR/CyaY-like superfamily)